MLCINNIILSVKKKNNTSYEKKEEDLKKKKIREKIANISLNDLCTFGVALLADQKKKMSHCLHIRKISSNTKKSMKPSQVPTSLLPFFYNSIYFRLSLLVLLSRCVTLMLIIKIKNKE